MERPKIQTSIYAPSGFTIIVIGAGIAGITAAYHLVLRGYNVLLLESRTRIGGRIDTIYLNENATAERGCKFIHGPGGNPLYPLLKRFHIELKPILHEKTIIYDKEGKPIDLESEDFHDIVRKKTEALSSKRLSQAAEFSHKGSSDFGTFVEKLKENTVFIPYRKDSLLVYKLGYHQEFSGGNYLVTNGLNHLVQGLLKEADETGALTLKLDQEITEIKDRGHKVIVTTKKGLSYDGDAVICTVPLGVLKENKIKFEPKLPENKIHALENLNMAIQEKTILEFDKPFWPENVHYLNPYDNKADIWREIVNLYYFSDRKTPTLVISNHVSDKNVLNKSDAEIINDALYMLKNIFGENISNLKHTEVTRWYEDPFSYGSYSYHLKNGTLNDNAALAEPYGRICFAGEHTSFFPSSIHGAYLSGIQAAEDIRALHYHSGKK